MARGRKVLCVDDDGVELIVIRAWLELAGYKVVTQKGPLGTTQVFLREKPDVVLLDMNMPGLSGDALGKLITQVTRKASVDIIFYSGEDPDVVRSRTMDLNVRGIIHKTHDGSIFLSQFERLLSQ